MKSIKIRYRLIEAKICGDSLYHALNKKSIEKKISIYLLHTSTATVPVISRSTPDPLQQTTSTKSHLKVLESRKLDKADVRGMTRNCMS